jgi:CheY-like chemotaxis protein
LSAQEKHKVGYNILIADPDAEFADLVAQAINDADSAYNVTVASDAQEAIAHLQTAQAEQRPYDLLIADVKTLGTSSMHMIEELPQSFPELKVVTMTAYHSPELATRIQQLGVYTHLVKPIAPSRFRRLVHNALAGMAADTDDKAAPPPLANAQLDAVERQLANLRRATESTAALLVHTGGTIRAMDCMDPELDASTLCDALMNAQHAIAQALAQTMQTQASIRQSLFSTDNYSVCVHRLDDKHAVATIFGPTVREGQVRYTLREGSDALQNALTAEAQEAPAQRSRSGSDGFNMVERYFAEQGALRTRPRRSTRERTPLSRAQADNPATPPINSLASSGAGITADSSPSPASQKENAQDQDHSVANTAPVQPTLPPPLEMERLEIDEIDWELGESQDWEALGVETNQSFLGMSYQEAQERGILDDLDPEQ